jgi:hypothetical protein
MIDLSRRALIATTLSAGLATGLRPRAAKAAVRPQLSEALADSHAKGVYVFGVENQGYLAEEYLMSGVADVSETVDMADAYDFSGRDNAADLGRRTFDLTVKSKDQPYVTRLIVYRPKVPARFSGNLIVESIHPSNGGSAAVWGPMNAFFLTHGDAYCLVQHPVTIPGLKGVAPDRYGRLSAAHPSQIWGMLRDAGVVLRSGEGPFGGLQVKRAYMTGYSYTGVATATFANFHHARARLPDGRPVFDGYLPMANATFVRPLDVPVMRMNTQSDFDSFGGLKNRGADSDASGAQYRLYEVTGAAHVRAPLKLEGAALAPLFSTPVPTAAGQPHNPAEACYASFPKGSRNNDVPFPFLAAAMFTNMYAWRDQGIAPPHAPLIETTDDGRTKTDEDGNALGGLRAPELLVPAATYGVGHGSCMLFGYAAPFDAQKMHALYGSKDAYLKATEEAAKSLVRQRFLPASATAPIIAAAGETAQF